ncbi:autoinducer binding domain-containing protein [uncultured Roseobacter sp.]|uniref:autoinducer binding domain-containing protein n=1 Tax=uncultured Roseobacter sp. TaxID=114847 RepID=UPI00261508B1|nr:autoinducer binding domain-containing protein [uncultured Roseobacter sp.]
MSHWVRAVLEEAIGNDAQRPAQVMEGLKRISHIIEESDAIQFRTDDMEELANSISVCDNLTELSQLLWQAATNSGFQHFSLFVVEQGRSANFSSRMCTSYGQNWLRRHEEKSYQFVDPVFLEAKSGNDSFLFSDLSTSSPLVREFWDDREEHNVGTKGMCYASTRPNGARIAVTFSSSDSEEKFSENIRFNRSDLEAVAQLAIEGFQHCASLTNLDDNTLSAQELRFLHTLATSSHPASALTMSSPYGGNNSLQVSIRRKLNVETIFQALATASANGWFDNLPFYSDDVVTPFPKLVGWEAAEMAETDT